MLGLGADGRLEWNVGDGSSRCDYDGPPSTMNDGAWHHVAFSFTRGSSGQVTLYFDGKIVEQIDCDIGSVSSNYPINIGTDGRGGVGWPAFYSGDIDKVMIFASALEHSQILEVYGQDRSYSATFAPSASPTIVAPTLPPTTRPTASPVTAPPTANPKGVSNHSTLHKLL